MQVINLSSSLLLVATSLVSIRAAPTQQMEERSVVNLNYTVNFALKNCAVQAPDYMTYAIKDSVNDCLDFCDSVSGCKFVNVYSDANSAKANGLTCSLYKSSHDASTLTNCGNQDQKGNGSKNSIYGSTGYVKQLSGFAI